LLYSFPKSDIIFRSDPDDDWNKLVHESCVERRYNSVQSYRLFNDETRNSNPLTKKRRELGLDNQQVCLISLSELHRWMRERYELFEQVSVNHLYKITESDEKKSDIPLLLSF